jgi:hypothetical protein
METPPSSTTKPTGETTLNTVNDFRVFRPKEGGPEDDLEWRVMRKGIADLHRRAQVSQKTNDRLMNALGSVDDSRSIEELTREIQEPAIWKGRRIRALRPWGDDHELLQVINNGAFFLNGFRNCDLQQRLYATAADSEAERRRHSAKVVRRRPACPGAERATLPPKDPCRFARSRPRNAPQDTQPLPARFAS